MKKNTSTEVLIGGKKLVCAQNSGLFSEIIFLEI